MKYTYKTGSIARDVLIDSCIDDERLLKKVYALWNNNKHKIEWQHLISCPGGEVSLTCEMILAVDYKELRKVYGVKDAKKLRLIAEERTEF